MRDALYQATDQASRFQDIMNRFQKEKKTVIDNVIEVAMEKPVSIFTQIVPETKPKSRESRSKSVI